MIVVQQRAWDSHHCKRTLRARYLQFRIGGPSFFALFFEAVAKLFEGTK